MDGPRGRPLESGRSRRTQPRSAAPRRRSTPAGGRRELTGWRRELAAQHNTPLAPFMQRSARRRHATAEHCAKSNPNRQHRRGRPTTADGRSAASATLVCGRARSASPEAPRSHTRVRTSACALIARSHACLLGYRLEHFHLPLPRVERLLARSLARLHQLRGLPHTAAFPLCSMPTFGRSHLPTPHAHIPTYRSPT